MSHDFGGDTGLQGDDGAIENHGDKPCPAGMSHGNRNDHDGPGDKSFASPVMAYAKNIKKSYFLVLDGAKPWNRPYIGGEGTQLLAMVHATSCIGLRN